MNKKSAKYLKLALMNLNAIRNNKGGTLKIDSEGHLKIDEETGFPIAYEGSISWENAINRINKITNTGY